MGNTSSRWTKWRRTSQEKALIMVKINRLQIQQHKQQPNSRTAIKKAKEEEITLIELTAATRPATTTIIIIDLDIKRTSKTSRLNPGII